MTAITFGNLSRADGSALINQDNNIIQALVFGPVDVPQSKINFEEAVVEILFKPKVSIPSTHPMFDHVRQVEDILRRTFQEVIMTRLHPRTSISILVQEIYNAGSLLSASVNAVSCALMDAGIPMKSPVSGVSVQFEDSSKFDLIFDRDLDLITILTHISVSEQVLAKAIEVGKVEAKKNFSEMRDKVKQRFL